MKRSGIRQTPRDHDAERSWEETRQQVFERARGRCEAATPACTRREPSDVHHRRLRSQGGGDDLVNLLALTRECHAFVHANPALSYERGWLLRAGQAP